MIIIKTADILAKRNLSMHELAKRVGLTNSTISLLKSRKGKSIKFSTLDELCEKLECQPGNILEYRKGI